MMSKGKDRKKRVYRKRGELAKEFVFLFFFSFFRVLVFKLPASKQTVPRFSRRRRRLLLLVQQARAGSRCEVSRLLGPGHKAFGLGCNASLAASKLPAFFLLPP
jgi:hypothetical protein